VQYKVEDFSYVQFEKGVLVQARDERSSRQETQSAHHLSDPINEATGTTTSTSTKTTTTTTEKDAAANQHDESSHSHIENRVF
jgi:hypothetical protein